MSFPNAVRFVIRYCLWLWFFLALLNFTFFEGWILTHFGLRWETLLPLALLLLLILSFFKNLSWNSWSKRACGLSAGALVATSLFSGAYVAQTNAFQFNTWMKNSVELLEASLNPVSMLNEKFALSPKTQERLKEWLLPKLHLTANVLGNDILVSFNSKGLAIVKDDGDVHFLTDKHSILANSSTLSDGSFFLYDKGTLTRAKIVDGALFKMWELKSTGLSFNHWGDTFNGLLYLPRYTYASLPNEYSRQLGYHYARCQLGRGIQDVIGVFNVETGEHVRDIPLLPIIAAYEKIDPMPAENIMSCHYPMHLNNIQIINTAEHAQFFPHGKVGDILISMRENNTVMLIDKDTLQAKWSVTGESVHQHSPRVTDHGTIVVFDNMGSDEENGRSRITEIDIATRKRIGYWEASGQQYFWAPNSGKVTLVDDGKRILVQSQSHSQIRTAEMFYLDCPGSHVSMKCKRTEIFYGEPKAVNYDNAFFLK